MFIQSLVLMSSLPSTSLCRGTTAVFTGQRRLSSTSCSHHKALSALKDRKQPPSLSQPLLLAVRVSVEDSSMEASFSVQRELQC